MGIVLNTMDQYSDIDDVLDKFKEEEAMEDETPEVEEKPRKKPRGRPKSRLYRNVSRENLFTECGCIRPNGTGTLTEKQAGQYKGLEPVDE